LLIETTLGEAIFQIEIERDDVGAIQSIIFMKGHPPQRVTRSLDDVLRLASANAHANAEMSRTFSDALRYCLTTGFPQAPTDEELEQHLMNFYDDVVAPYD
jgi:hypothetical protein